MATIQKPLTPKALPTNYKPKLKPLFIKTILNDKEVKHTLLAHNKQSELNRNDTEKFRNTHKKQLCVEMLGKGFHKSFVELENLLKLQIEDRYNIGSDHPIWDRPLLDQEPEKLEYLCEKLNTAEDAERNGYSKVVYNCYHDLANYFMSTDDSWLSDYFFNKCLSCVSEDMLDPQKAAESHCNIGLAYERQTKDYTAKSDKIRGNFFQAMKHFEQYYELCKNKDWVVDASKRDYSNETTVTEDNITYTKDNSLFTDACINLQRIYKVIASKYAQNPEEKIDYLTKARDVCRESKIKALEGQISYLLGNAFIENNDYDTALVCFNNFYEISKKRKDVENYGIAAEALSMCHEKMGNMKKGVEYLQKYLHEISPKEAGKQYSRACSCLANIYNSQGEYDKAVEYSTKGFELTREMNDRSSTEYNRVLLGIVKGHKMLNNFNKNVELNTKESMNNIIKWKSSFTSDDFNTIVSNNNTDK